MLEQEVCISRNPVGTEMVHAGDLLAIGSQELAKSRDLRVVAACSEDRFKKGCDPVDRGAVLLAQISHIEFEGCFKIIDTFHLSLHFAFRVKRPMTVEMDDPRELRLSD